MNEIQRLIIERRQLRIEVQPVPQDRYYRCLVSLKRTDRPRYWGFRCHNCGEKVVELQNLEVFTIDDFYDPQDINNTAIGKVCHGKVDGKRCGYMYFFHVG